ncbi:MAG: TolC family outer membrane protein [Xanthomonadales bacterium]|nr:TolC family outer membrane protein [Xanthomonadales bacterium]
MNPLRSVKPLALAVVLTLVAGAADASDLLEAYELARTSDPQLAAAEASQLATGEGVTISRASLLPRITGTAQLNDNEQDGTNVSTRPNADGTVSFGESSGGSDTRSRSYSLGLQQSIYNHGNYTRLRASRARADRASADLDAARQGLMQRVSEAYFGVLTAIDSVVFSRAERKAVKRQLDQAEQRFEVGLTAITDVHEARARYDGARASAIAAENALDDAREALAEITGRWVEGVRGLGESFQPALPEPAAAQDWVDSALQHNPSLISRELALVAAGHDVATARSAHLPTLSASISRSDSATWGNSFSNEFSFPATSSGNSTAIGLTLTVPIFEGFGTQAGVRQAVYNRDAVEDQLEQERRSVVRQTRNAYRALEAGISEVAARQQALVSARSALEATEAGFEVGTRTIVDVLLSQQQLFQAQRDYSQARHNFLVNGLRLRSAAGTIAVGDLQAVNGFLVRDAEAALMESEQGAEQD